MTRNVGTDYSTVTDSIGESDITLKKNPINMNSPEAVCEMPERKGADESIEPTRATNVSEETNTSSEATRQWPAKGILKRSKTDLNGSKRPIIKQCSFQMNRQQQDSPTVHSPHRPHLHHPEEHAHKKKSLADTLPEIMAKFKKELKAKDFILKTKKAIGDRKLLQKPERQWIKGNEMTAFYHTWQTSEDHVKDQRLRPSTVQRRNSLPRSFRAPDFIADDNKQTRTNSQFGCVRECCSRPRMRIPTFLDHHDDQHDHHV